MRQFEGAGQGEIINLADRRAEASRLAQIDMLVSLGPDMIAREFSVLESSGNQLHLALLDANVIYSIRGVAS
jgi:uncharacterized protein